MNEHRTRQQAALAAIVRHFRTYGTPPTCSWLGDALGTSDASARDTIYWLANKGLVKLCRQNGRLIESVPGLVVRIAYAEGVAGDALRVAMGRETLLS